MASLEWMPGNIGELRTSSRPRRRRAATSGRVGAMGEWVPFILFLAVIAMMPIVYGANASYFEMRKELKKRGLDPGGGSWHSLEVLTRYRELVASRDPEQERLLGILRRARRFSLLASVPALALLASIAWVNHGFLVVAIPLLGYWVYMITRTLDPPQ